MVITLAAGSKQYAQSVYTNIYRNDLLRNVPKLSRWDTLFLETHKRDKKGTWTKKLKIGRHISVAQHKLSNIT